MYNKPHRSPFWPTPTAHRIHWEQNNCPHVYEYDPTDDGPEVEIITRIKIAHPFTWDASINRAALNLSRGAADWLFTALAALAIEEKHQ